MTQGEETGGRQRDAAAGYRPVDLAIAASLLTRLPVPVDHALAGRRIARAGWAYPLVGAAIGVLGGGLYAGLVWLGVGAFAAAALAVGAQALATGAMHEDGFADAVDGLGAPGRDAEARIAIMRDSRLGAFGGLALMIALAARIGALGAMSPMLGLAAMTAAGALSRAVPPVLMVVMPPADRSGLAARAGRGAADVATIAAMSGVLLAWAALDLAAPTTSVARGLGLAAVVATLCVAFLARAAQRRIGGQTGDVLGAAALTVETVALVVLGAALTPA